MSAANAVNTSIRLILSVVTASVLGCTAIESEDREEVTSEYEEVATSELANRLVYIVNQWRCEQGDSRCGYHLSFTGRDAQLYPPGAHTDLVPWRLRPVPGTTDEFYMYSQWRCSQGEARCGMHLSFTGTNVELYPADNTFDLVPWKFVPVPGTTDEYYIRNRWRCRQGDTRCDMHLSFTGTDVQLYPRDNTYDLTPWRVTIVEN